MNLIPQKLIAGLISALASKATLTIGENWTPGVAFSSSGGTCTLDSLFYNRFDKCGYVYDFQIQVSFEVTGSTATAVNVTIDTPENVNIGQPVNAVIGQKASGSGNIYNQGVVDYIYVQLSSSYAIGVHSFYISGRFTMEI